MKKIIKRQTHYCLLLMRDDREVRSVRVRASFLRFCLFVCFLLLVCAGLSIAGGWHYWKKAVALNTRLLALEQELTETKRHLEQLTNESVLWRNTQKPAPALKNEDMGTPDADITVAVGVVVNRGRVPVSVAPPLHHRPRDGMDGLQDEETYYVRAYMKLSNGKKLVLETKGQKNRQSEVKRKALEEWTIAVNETGEYGAWHCDISYNIADVDGIIAKYADSNEGSDEK